MGLHQHVHPVSQESQVFVHCDACDHLVTTGEYNARMVEGKQQYFCLPCSRARATEFETIDDVQHDIDQWNLRNFSEEYPRDRLVVASYYVGRLQFLQMKSGRNTMVFSEPEKIKESIGEAIGDAVIALMAYATDNRLNFFDTLVDRWEEVRELNFARFPINGKDH